VKNFTEVEDELIVYYIKKATGRDGISAKIKKIVKPVIAKPISELVNKSISLGKFPEKFSDTSVWLFIILLSSTNIISFLQLLLLLKKRFYNKINIKKATGRDGISAKI
jgi:hypothetical protein